VCNNPRYYEEMWYRKMLMAFGLLALTILGGVITIMSTQWLTTTAYMEASIYPSRLFANEVKETDEVLDLSGEHQKRREHVQQVCRRHPSAFSVTSDISRYFSFSDRHHLVYCAIQKVGCSFWLRVMRILTGQVANGSLFNGSFLHQRGATGKYAFKGKPTSTQRQILNSYNKFMFVRDPYSRLFSGYMDKVFLPTRRIFAVLRRVGVQNVIGRQTPILGNNDANFKDKFQCITNVPFNVFVKAVTSGQVTDPHYSPMYRHCNPCEVDFNFIGKMENFMEDAEYILSQGGVNLSELHPETGAFSTNNDLTVIADLAKSNLKRPRKINCSKSYMCEVFLRVWVALQTRGLISNKVSFPLPPTNCKNISTNAFINILKHAYMESGSREERMRQRHDAMMEAYYSLPRDLLQRVQNYVQRDCDLFGYECSIDVRFPHVRRDHHPSNFSFFDRFWK
ncbi:hypothetical protein BaRGS_00021192, partial [Batillaria attramentaria]